MQLRALGIAVGLVACGDSKAVPDAPPVVVDAAPDASPFHATVTGAITTLQSANGPGGAPVVTTGTPDVTTIHLGVSRDDGTLEPVLVASDGTFHFGVAAAGDPYDFVLAIDGQSPKNYQSRAASLEIALLGAGHVPRAPVASDVVVKAVFDNWVPGDTAVLQTTGLWTDTDAPFVTNPAPNQTEPWAFQWRWAGVTSLSGALGLLDAAQHDVLAIGAWHLDAAKGYEAMTGALVHSDVTMASGTNLPFGADDAPIQVPALPQRCVHVVAPRGGELARIESAVPDAYTKGQTEWALMSPAGDGIGPLAAQDLAVGRETIVGSGAGAGAGSDADLTASFGAPFGGSKLLVSVAAHPIRVIHAAPADDGVALRAGTQTWAEVDMPVGCAPSPAAAEVLPAVAVPSIPALDGVRLDTDDRADLIHGDGAPDVTVTWTQAGSGVADEYVVNLVHVTGDGTNAPTLETVRSVFTTGTTARFPYADMASDGVYLVEVFARQGFPGAATGDFATIAFPFANAVTISHTFHTPGIPI